MRLVHFPASRNRAYYENNYNPMIINESIMLNAPEKF